MTTQSTIDKLIEMRLTSMSDAFLTQLQDARMRDISFEDRFGMLVDIEYSNRKSNSLKRLIRNAGFDHRGYQLYLRAETQPQPDRASGNL